jgi:acetolactate synthase-1/2/3 large subunit
MANTRDIVADTMIEAGIEYVFGMPGGSNMFMFDPLFDRQDRIKTVLVRNEQCASGMADMIGRLSGKPAAIIAQGAWLASSSGLGVLEAFQAGSPMLILSEFSDYGGLTQHMPYQCGSGEYGSADHRSIFKGMCKFVTVAHSPSEFIHGVQLAIKHAVTGRPGPAAVIARWNVVTSQVDEETITPPLWGVDSVKGRLGVEPACLSPEAVDRISDYLIKAEDPIMICGMGIHMARAYPEVQELAELIGMPVATSVMGKSSIAETHDLALGGTGNFGQKAANEKLLEADLIFAIGTGLAPENHKMLGPDWINPKKQKIVQIDIEPLNIGFTYPVEYGAVSEAKRALRLLIEVIKDKKPGIDAAARVESVKKYKSERNFFTDPAFTSDETPIAPERVVKDLNDTLGEDDLLVLDGGNNRVWMHKYFQCKKAGQIVAPGGVTPIGWSVTAGLAAQMHKKDGRVACFLGDGGMMLQLYGLEMARDYGLPITYVVINNSCLGNVMDFQPDDRRLATTYDRPMFADIAKSVGIEGFRVDKAEDVKGALNEAINSDKPALVDISTSQQKHFKVMMG